MPKERNHSVSLEDLISSFREKNFVPLYLFHGEEDFLMKEALDAFLDHALDLSSRSFNLDILYGGDVDVKDVVSHASQFPMMAERRVVVIRDAEKLATSEGSRQILLRYLKSPVPSTILVFIAPNADMRLSTFRAFQEHGVSVEFKHLPHHRIADWIAQRVQKSGWRITPEACQLIQAHVGTSLSEIHNEIEKLFIYAGEKRVIEAEDVSAIVGMSKVFNIFELQRAVGAGDISRSMEILEHMLDAGESPLGMIVMLTRFFQKLWIIPSLRGQSEGGLASVLQVSPFFVREYLSAARRFSPQHIQRAFTALLDADVTLKSSQEDPKIVMTTLVYKLINPVHEPVEYSSLE